MRQIFIFTFAAISLVACNNSASTSNTSPASASANETASTTQTSEKKEQGLPTGKFVSTEDPKSVIEFKNGHFIETYDNEVMTDYPYNYDPTCDNCKSNFNEGTSAGDNHAGCFKYTDSSGDTFAYIILTSNDDEFEYSMIGGRGNTLSCKRMK